MKKISIAIISVLCTFMFSLPVHANTDYKDNFHNTFKGTLIEESEVKLKKIVSKFKDGRTKKEISEKWRLAKDWIGYKWNRYGTHTLPTEGLEFYNDSNFQDKYYEKVFFTVKIGLFHNYLYFSNEKGEEIPQLFWTDSIDITILEYRFIQIVANSPVTTNFVPVSPINQFPDNSYYVWAELKLANGNTIFRPVPVSAKTFNKLKESKKGKKFTPYFKK